MDRIAARRRIPAVSRISAVAAAAILVGGAALGLTLAADDPAPAPERPGFEAAPGWDTWSTGMTSPPQAPTAITANVAIDPADGTGGIPHRTLEGLPAHGVVIWATFYPLGHEFEGSAEERDLPLRLADTVEIGSFEGQPPNVTARRVTARVDRYEIDVLVFFGRADPDRTLLDEADAALGRLVPPE